MSVAGDPVTRSEPVAGHRRRPAPHDHLCTCGRLREDCLREVIRLVWG